MRLAAVIYTALIAVGYSVPVSPEPQTPSYMYRMSIEEHDTGDYDLLVKFIINKTGETANINTYKERRKVDEATAAEELRITKSLKAMLDGHSLGRLVHKLLGHDKKVDFRRIKYEGYYDPTQLPRASESNKMGFFRMERILPEKEVQKEGGKEVKKAGKKEPNCALGCLGWVATVRVKGKDKDFGELLSVKEGIDGEHETVAKQAPDREIWKRLHVKFEKDFLMAT